MDLAQSLRTDIVEQMKIAFGAEYAGRFPQRFVDKVAADVMETAAFMEGHYNTTDIQWALARTVLAICSLDD